MPSSYSKLTLEVNDTLDPIGFDNNLSRPLISAEGGINLEIDDIDGTVSTLGGDIISDVNANTDSATGGITTDVNDNTDIQPKVQSAMGFSVLFGDGRDGNVGVSGTTNVNDDKQYNNLTISGTLTSSTNKYIYIAVKDTLTISNGGSINISGKGSSGDGAGSGAGVEYLDFTTRYGTSGGGAGGSGTSYGGTGFNGYSSGGAGSRYENTASAGVAINTDTKNLAFLNSNILLKCWGAAGGTSAGNGNAGHSAGGAGGGVIYIEAKTIVITDSANTIVANGANGIDGYNDGGNEGGSGGGGGGIIFIKYYSLSNITANNSNFTVTGGAGGAKAINSGAGGTGGAGYVFLQQISK